MTELVLKTSMSIVKEPSTLQEPVAQAEARQHAKITDVYPDLRPDLDYLTHHQSPWPEVKGAPFCIYTELIEDQLSAEAEAASPLRYDDGDKENDVINPELVPDPDPLDSVSIRPASHYRQRAGLDALFIQHSMVNNAFYMQPHLEAPPYGLGWSNGAQNRNDADLRNCPSPNFMRILASSENLPRSSTPTETCKSGGDASVSSSPVRNLGHLDLRR